MGISDRFYLKLNYDDLYQLSSGVRYTGFFSTPDSRLPTPSVRLQSSN
ncbi:hypothetical protein BJP36_35590 [Moorena producens JHB]|uniref:Uncharacterized protein n=1 Tax=Moorena producens (strain JHB) TaxID=1454205 RepID=A0A9Q9STM4_MOOP1|nr:hypothetical protein [Moorena producens]WAN69417.1 hypothetical protein BJP36_35590 [Moorena producens JHB]